MSAPVAYTCPKIDETISDISAAFDCIADLEAAVKALKALGGLICVNGNLETLRGMNEALREWGEGIEAELQDTQLERDLLEVKCDGLQNEITILNEKIERLEREIGAAA